MPETPATHHEGEPHSRGPEPVPPELGVGIELARATHTNFQEMVKVADAKATTLAGVQSVVMGVVLSSSAAGPKSLIAGFALVSAASILSGLLVLMPRFPVFRHAPASSRGLLWIAGVAPFDEQPDRYLEALRGTTQELLLADYAFENIKVASLLGKKFRWLRLSVSLLLVAVPLFLLLVLSTLMKE